MTSITIDLEDVTPRVAAAVSNMLADLHHAVLYGEVQPDATSCNEVEPDGDAFHFNDEMKKGSMNVIEEVTQDNKENFHMATNAEPEQPSATTTEPEQPAAIVALDKAGIPWDERIHSSSRKFKKDGTWKLARNLDKSVLMQVQSELAHNAHMTANVIDAGTVFGGSEVNETVFGDNQPETEQAPATAAAVAFGGAATTPPVELTWPMFIGKMIAAQKAKLIDEAKFQNFLAANNVANTALLAQRNDLWQPIITEFNL